MSRRISIQPHGSLFTSFDPRTLIQLGRVSERGSSCYSLDCELPLDLLISSYLQMKKGKLTNSSSCCFESRAIFNISRSLFNSTLRRCRVEISRSFDADSDRRRAISAWSAGSAEVVWASCNRVAWMDLINCHVSFLGFENSSRD
jgi:hypothetical protein